MGGSIMYFRPKRAYMPKQRWSYEDPGKFFGFPGGVGIFLGAVMASTFGSDWPNWTAFIPGVALLCWFVVGQISNYNELVHQWNTKIDEEEASAKRAEA